MKNVLYTGAFRFPNQDAAALRVYSIARLFEQVGCCVTFAGWEQAQDEKKHYVFEGHDCYPQSEFREYPRRLIGRLLGFFMRGFKTLRWLESSPRFDIIVTYNPPALFSLLLLLLCWRRRICLVLDSTEWYEAEHLPGGQFGPAALENWLRMRVVYPRFRNIICISRLLEKHYAGCNIVNIPPLQPPAKVDTDGIVNATREPITSGITFIYAGNGGEKDRLLGFIRVLPVIAQSLQRNILLRIAGIEETTLYCLFRDEDLNITTYAPFVKCYGRISHARVNQLYNQSHFSVLFRENKRYAWAGFPTKAMESWSHACPIIMNRIGDIGILAENMVDAIIVDEKNIVKTLDPALRMIIESDQYQEMSNQSRIKASLLFSADKHLNHFKQFFQNLRWR
ncbi:MAG: glycosyltransferase [Nitrospirota bacterium]